MTHAELASKSAKILADSIDKNLVAETDKLLRQQDERFIEEASFVISVASLVISMAGLIIGWLQLFSDKSPSDDELIEKVLERTKNVNIDEKTRREVATVVVNIAFENDDNA